MTEQTEEENLLPDLPTLAEDPAFSVLFQGMKCFWQSYLVCHAATLRHLAITHPHLSDEARIGLVSKCASAAVEAAKKQPPTAKTLYEKFKTICGPILRELGVSEDEIQELEKDASADPGM